MLSKTNFADMHDGDTKDVELANGVLTISDPGGSWQTQLDLDPTTCSGQVDFNVPGKPNPPDENLTLAMLSSFASESSCSSSSNYVLSFSEVGDTGYTPVNQWVQPTGTQVPGTNYTCFPEDQTSRNTFYVDVGAGDQKIVKTSCSSATCTVEITPKTGDASWTITGNIDRTTCSGMVDGTPAGMQASLRASFRVSRWFGQTILMDADTSPLEYFLEFTDPDGTQVNQWVELGNPDILPTAPASVSRLGTGTTAAPAIVA